ncbi:MAG: serine/threonine protein kinase, partial [Vicinamibacteraceae bacterium]|nr:serine/threonine protein kinase [Vicinamibacteraceae bacterium]
QGVQYALARGLWLALVLLLAAIIAVDVYVHRARAIAEVIRLRGAWYGLAGVVVLAMLGTRRRWLDALDKRFFRERYDAERILKDVAVELRQAQDPRDAVALVARQISEAVQPRFIVPLEAAEGETELRPVAEGPWAGPNGARLPADHGRVAADLRLPVASRLVALAAAIGAPLELSPDQDAWIARHLPPDEALWVAEHAVELLVPVTMSAARPVMLALGARRSEEPYARRDIALLQAVAANLALVLERGLPPVAAAAGEITGEEPAALAECPTCARCFDTTLARCPDDGALLLSSDLPAVLDGRYRLVERLGAGGMGTVYAAHDEALDRVVAVKVLAPHLVGTPGAAQRFQREARTAAGFTHPHVVTIHDFGVTERGRAFLVMERLEGSTLRDAIAREGGLAPADACRIVSEVCEVLEAAHARGLVHRDLKPENIFLARTGREEGVVKVLDFGIAKAVAQATDVPTATATGVIVGSVAYMAPEQWRGEPVDRRWDLWALAVVAFEMLTGTRPSTTSTAASISPEAPARGRLSEATDRFFTAALSPDAHVRPQDAREFASRFAEACRP